MENGICGTRHDINIDTQLANDTLLCMYAEFCACCNLTANVFAAHSGRKNAVLVSDLIASTRFNVLNSQGFVQKSLPMINYILKHNQIPSGRNSRSSNLVDNVTAACIFRHLNGARQLRQSKATGEQLGNALYRCFLTGCVLNCEKEPVLTEDLIKECNLPDACALCCAFRNIDTEWLAYSPSNSIELYLKEYSDQLEIRLVQSACNVV